MRRKGTPRAFGLLASLAVGALLLWPRPSLADHSLGLACLTCHSLKSLSVVPGSRNIFRDQLTAPLYGWVLAPGTPPANPTYWYCDPGQAVPVFGSNNRYWDPPAANPPLLQPLDCSYCHNSATDIPGQFEDAFTAGGPLADGNASAHPVAVSLGGPRQWNNWTSSGRDRILCNDCHNSEVGPAGPCENDSNDGYPNHIRTTLSNLTPATLGNNNRARVDPKYAHLRTTSYGPDVNWAADVLGAAGEGMLCFGTSAQGCHVAGGKADNLEDVQAAYDTAGGGKGGGHNVRYALTTGGILQDKKMACHFCHDPHATSVNKKLLIDNSWAAVGRTDPYDATATFYVGTLGGGGYTGANDRAVCGGCHDGTKQIGGAAVPNFTISTNLAFPFHDNVHAGVTASGNCLQKNSGCHQGAHNVDYFRCLDCHSGQTIGTSATTAAVPESVRYTHSEFPHIVKSGGQPPFTAANSVQSAHSIPYYDDVNNDMSLPQNNGCLFCHDARGKPAGTILVDADGNPYPRFAPETDGRRSLDHYNRFCLSCHDGSGPSFTLTAPYSFYDGVSGVVSYPAATLMAPKINNPQAGWDDGYYFSIGHGRGSNDKNDTAYPSGNSPARIACLECHLYHGSTAFKLLPGPRETSDGRGHVVKGHSYMTTTPVGTLYSIGGVDDSTQIDYKDYTDRANNIRIRSNFNGSSINGSNYFLSRYCSDYRNGTPWSTYFDGTTIGAGDLPVCTPTFFGTSGDMLAGNTNTFGSANDTQSAPDATQTMPIGFCNTCHFYETLGGDDGTKETAGLAYTHEGYAYAVGASNPYGVDSDGRPLKSKNNFFKDCVECHDPHGSGKGTAGDTSERNAYMIRRKIKHGLVASGTSPTASDWSSVVFLTRTGADSYDENDTDNKDDLCAVCHQSNSENSENFVKFDYRSWTGSPAGAKHMTGANCTVRCHRHGLK